LYNAAFPTFSIDRKHNNKILAAVDILTPTFRESPWKCGVAELQSNQRKQLLCCSQIMLIFRLARGTPSYSEQMHLEPQIPKFQNSKMHLVRFILKRFLSVFPAAFPLDSHTAVAQAS
jgi:hypothetical protein